MELKYIRLESHFHDSSVVGRRKVTCSIPVRGVYFWMNTVDFQFCLHMDFWIVPERPQTVCLVAEVPFSVSTLRVQRLLLNRFNVATIFVT